MLVRCLFLVVALGCCAPLFGQDYPRYEAFGGFSIISPGDQHLYGWQASIARNFNKRFGVVGDIGGGYRTITFGSTQVNGRSYSFLGGPRVTFRSDRVTGFVHGLAGLVNAGGSAGGTSASVNGFHFGVGGGLDVKVGDRVSIRAIQTDLLVSHLLDDWGGDIRLGFGVVIPFGR